MLRRTVALAACLFLPLTACSSSSKHSASTTTSTTSSSSSTSTSTTVSVPKAFSSGDLAAFCKAWVDVQTLSAEVPPNASPQQTKDGYTKVLAAGRRLQTAASTEIKAAVDYAVNVTEKVANSGSTAPFSTDENKRNVALITSYANAHCASK